MGLFTKRFFTRAEEEIVVAAIRAAERCTSGEIRVHIHQHKCKSDPMEEATETFYRLEMDKTALHNGVLFYVAPKNRAFIILGDKGINEVVPDDFWNNTRDMMQGYFREGKFVEGLERGILRAGDQLKQYFPYQADDENELPDEISYT